MLEYYNERANEYEDVYTLGTRSASLDEPRLFQSEAIVLSKVVAAFGHDRLIDIASGTSLIVRTAFSQPSSAAKLETDALSPLRSGAGDQKQLHRVAETP